MSLDCILAVNHFGSEEYLEINARLELLPQVGHKVFIDDLTYQPGQGPEMNIAGIYLVEEVTHHLVVNREAGNKELLARFRDNCFTYRVYLKQESE